MKLIFKKMMMLYIGLSLIITPIHSLAVQKKSHKRIQTSQKSSVKSGFKNSLKSKNAKSRVSVRYDLKNGKTKKVTYLSHGGNQLRNHSIARTNPFNSQNAFSLDNFDGSGDLILGSTKALIINQNTGEVVFSKNTQTVAPIASITKLMTAMVVLDARLSPNDDLTISYDDVDYVKSSSSRLAVGAILTRNDMLHLALMASENRAASAVARYYPGGKQAFVKAMNVKALEIGATHAHFVDPTGLDGNNVASAEDLAKLVQAAYQYPEIRAATTSPSHEVYIGNNSYTVNFNNTNGLVRGGEWQIGLSKTGYTSEAGRCLVMQANIAGEPMIIVLLDSNGKLTRLGDANRIRKWMEYHTVAKPMITIDEIELEPGTVS